MGSARAPAGLLDRGPGKALWRSIANSYELRPDELRILEDACREADLIKKLQDELDHPDQKLIVEGSMGQPVSNPLVPEIRQHRATLGRLLQSLKLPDAPSSSGKTTSANARNAAAARWNKRRGA